MEAQIETTGGRRWRPSPRLLLSGVLALALLGAVGSIASANGGVGRPGGDVTITAIDGNNVTLTSSDGWTTTIDASKATVTSGTTAATVADLKVGDSVTLSESRNFDGSVTVTAITVVAPNVQGVVTAVDASSLTVRETDGTSKTVTLDASTTYAVNGAAATQSAISVGSAVTVEGTANADGTFTATSVAAHPASVSGTVTATTADTITVADASGATLTIQVNASTTYRTASGAGTLADVTVGSVVRAQGVYDADGSFAASSVSIGTDTAPFDDHGGNSPGDHNGGSRGNGFGNQPGFGGQPGFGNMPGMPGNPANPANPTSPSTPASPSPSVSPSASPSA
jgi:hypothetical protein